MHFTYDFLCLIPSTTASHVSICYIYIYISALKQKKKVGYFNYFFRCNILFRFFLNPRKRLLHNKLLNWFPTLHSSSHISLSRRFYAKFSIKKDSLNIVLWAGNLSNKGENTNRNKVSSTDIVSDNVPWFLANIFSIEVKSPNCDGFV